MIVLVVSHHEHLGDIRATLRPLSVLSNCHGGSRIILIVVYIALTLVGLLVKDRPGRRFLLVVSLGASAGGGTVEMVKPHVRQV